MKKYLLKVCGVVAVVAESCVCCDSVLYFCLLFYFDLCPRCATAIASKMISSPNWNFDLKFLQDKYTERKLSKKMKKKTTQLHQRQVL